MPVNSKILFNDRIEEYTVLEQLLNEMGYELEQGYTDHYLYEMKLQEIEKYNALVVSASPLASSTRQITDSEIADAKRYILKGEGGLLLIYSPSIYKQDKLNRATAQVMKIGETFGIKQYPDEVNDYSLTNRKNVNFLVEKHILTQGVKKIHSTDDFYPLVLNENIAKSLISVKTTFECRFNPPNPDYWFHRKIKGIHPIFAINSDYRVAVLSPNDDIFNDRSINLGDNKQLALNLFPWLCGIEEKPETKKTLPFVYNP